MNKSNYREDLVFYLLREHIDRDKINKIIGNFKEKDWAETGDFLKEHGLFSVFYERVTGLNLESIPPEFLTRLKKLYLLNIKKNAFLERELFKITDYLGKSDIPVIPLKGITLASLLYNDIALRKTSWDLDLLVPYERLKEAEEKLQETGFSFCLNRNMIDFQHMASKEICLHKKIDRHDMLLDLHWNINENLTHNHLREFWLNAREVNLKGHRILMPSKEDLLLYLSLSSVSHKEFVVIKYIYDIHKMITVYGKEIDWTELVRKAKRNKLDKILFYSLLFSRDLFATPVPEEVIESTGPSLIKKVFLRQWINKDNVLNMNKYIASSRIWRFFISTLLYTNNFSDYLGLIVNRRFWPMECFVKYYPDESGVPFGIRLRKLLLKVVKCFFRIGYKEKKEVCPVMFHLLS